MPLWKKDELLCGKAGESVGKASKIRIAKLVGVSRNEDKYRLELEVLVNL